MRYTLASALWLEYHPAPFTGECRRTYKKAGNAMSTIISQSDLLRRAVVYIDEALKEKPERNLPALIDETSMRFNLSPLEGASLQRLFSNNTGQGGKKGDTQA